MKLRPLGDRIVVTPLAEAETTKSGIILPDTVDKEKKAEGEILGVGDGEISGVGVGDEAGVGVGVAVGVGVD